MKRSIKKLTALLLALMMIMPLSITGVLAAEAEAENQSKIYTPTENWVPNEDGILEISSPEDLLAFSTMRGSEEYGSYSGMTIILTQDIDLNPGWDASSGTEPSNVWEPLTWFFGTFDGQGYTIRGLYCKSNNTSGFISNGAATKIKNLTVKNSYFEGRSYTGFVSTIKSWTTFDNVYIDAIIRSTEGAAGGFSAAYLGRAGISDEASELTPASKFTNCVFAGSVTAKTYAGGILGSNDKIEYGSTEADGKDFGHGNYAVTLIDCANYGVIVSTTKNKTAGLIGICANTTTMNHCYGAGTADAALFNAQKSTLPTTSKPGVAPPAPAAIALTDCYYSGIMSPAIIYSTEDTPPIALAYSSAVEGEEFRIVRVARFDTLLEKINREENSKGNEWVLSDDGSMAMTRTLLCQAEGHSYETKKFDATCVAQGFTAHVCTECEFSYTLDTDPMLDHIPSGEWIIDKEPTALSFGGKHMNCTRCENAVWMETIDKLILVEEQEDEDDELETESETLTEADNITAEEEEPRGIAKFFSSIINFFKGIFEAIFGKKE